MPLRYDVLVVDLDGTLLGRDGCVSPANCAALGAARRAGLEVIIATGRALRECRGCLASVEHDGLVIAAGGSLLCEASTGRTLLRHAMPRDLVKDVAQPLLADGHKLLILKDAHATGYDYLAVGSAPLDPASQWWFDHLQVDVRHIDDLAADEHPDDSVRAGVVASEGQLKPLATMLRQTLGDRCFLQHWPAVTATHAIGSNTHLLEVFRSHVNKWTAVRSWCERRNLNVHRVAAIGDGLNDVELVANAGLGVAMGNAIPEVARVADCVTADHDHDGVAEAVTRILDGEW